MLPANVPSDATQKKILKAFKKIGFILLPQGLGKGSHRLVEDPRTHTVVTVQYHIYKEVIRSYCKDVERLGYDAQEFVRYI